MYFVFSFWYKPTQNKRFDYLTYENIMLYHAMSNAFIKHIGQKTHLMTDKAGAELLSFIDYDKVTIMDELEDNSHNFLFSALPKFYALKRMDIEDVLIDYDLFIYKPQTLELLKNKDCDMIYSFYEGSEMPNINSKVAADHNYLLDKIRKYQKDIEYKIPVNSLEVSYPNTSLMKFNNQSFKDKIVSNYFKYYELLKNEDFSDCLWPDIYIEQYFIGSEAKIHNYIMTPIIPNYNIDRNENERYANEIGFCHLGAQKNNMKSSSIDFFRKYDPERFNLFSQAYQKICQMN